jgi:predicted enzyme related to lactoylglutathione lyase
LTIQARFTHTNIVAQDWKRLAEFYVKVFGCTLVHPERNLSGRWLEDGTGVPGAQIHGAHLRLPGYGEQGPTLEIFQYNRHKERPETASNRLGFGHIAFAVEDVEAARDAIIAAGGDFIGETVTVEIAGSGTITFVYATDPEENIIELQHWTR